MSVITAVETITGREYEQLLYTGSAGPTPAIEDSTVLDQWREQFPHWRGKYWAFTGTDHGVLRLRPINVAARQPAAVPA
ncbi:hypothetical protein [Nocardia pseudovaccinii]|uniref:hypothetical protein n=1 Tax=Nocardia pseudovaccinii TaxID=189540 RepID=UPI0007A49321|nr:hypothetical protein [Nocardia pseudovaccinii]